MFEQVKALIVVMVLATPAFYVGRQLAVTMIAPREFVIWRNLWFAVTVAAFLSGSFFVFAAIVMMICLYARVQRAATVALFVVLLFTVPLVPVYIGGFDIVNQLIDVNNARVLAIMLLLPIVFAGGKSNRQNGRVYSVPDRIIVGYVLLQIFLKSENITQGMRWAVALSLDVLIPYFAFSRAVTSVADLRKVLLAFIIAMLPISLIAVFETAKGWLLYGVVMHGWATMVTTYLERGGMLRALASAGQPIDLGYIIMVAIGCVFAVRQSTGSRNSGIALAILSAGLVASLSRGPWVGAVILLLVYLAISPNAATNVARFLVIGVLILVPLLFTPLGSQLLDMLPFIGTIDAGSVTYRQQLFDAAIQIIGRNPWFGSRDYRLTPEMQELVQGQHIVDVVNTYLGVALDYGLVGLGFFVAFFATVLIGLRRALKFDGVWDLGLGNYMRASIAILVAILVTIGTASSIGFIPYVYWSFAGLCVALIRIAYQERAEVARAANAIGVPA
jgi:O-antigen ligase